jgi:hypothetical protein
MSIIDPQDCLVLDEMRSNMSFAFFPVTLFATAIIAHLSFVIVRLSGDWDIMYGFCGPGRICQAFWYAGNFRTKLYRCSFSQRFPVWIGVLGYALFVSEFIIFSMFSLQPFAGLVAAYVMGEFYLQGYNLVVGLPDDITTIVEHEIEAMGLQWIYKQNSRTLIITDENLDHLRKLRDYSTIVPRDDQGRYLNVSCAWPSKVYLSGRKRVIKVEELRDFDELGLLMDGYVLHDSPGRE